MTDPNRTLIVGLLDRTGSMSRLKRDVEGAWDHFIGQQRDADLGDEVLVSLYQFDAFQGSEVLEVVYELYPIASVPGLNLLPRGGTPLYDAIGLTIHKVGKQLADMEEAHRPGRIYFAIMTDGDENSSQEYTLDQVKALITEHQDTWKWEFHFMGVGIDAYSVGGSIGIARGTTYSVVGSAAGVADAYSESSRNIAASRSTRGGG